jgi:hypothetical protein
MENKINNIEINDLNKNNDLHFIKIRNEMRVFLAERNLYPQIARRLGVSINTVRRTFELTCSEKDLKGNRWQVWNTAIDLIYSVKTLTSRAEKVLEL